ncbi:MAG: DUF6290 family protein [Spirochaeta sp.]|jgi:predicted transcriptional regulator|nr:DUF6290 family protein [Spirochaeta sp.]
MGVKSVRFNTDEEKALNVLTQTLRMDTSAVIKKALWDLYEEMQDRAVIEGFEVREDAGEVSFASIDDLIAPTDRADPGT